MFRTSLALVITLGWLSASVSAATYTYQTIDPPPAWNAVSLFIHGMNDLGGLVGHTLEADGINARDWRFIPSLGMMRWNIPKNARHSIKDINNRGHIVQLVDPNGSGEQVWLCQPSPCTVLPIPDLAPRADRLSNSGLVVGDYPKFLQEFPGFDNTTVGYIYDTQAKKLTELAIPGWTNTTLTGITDDGMFTGFVARSGETTDPGAVSVVGDETQIQPFVIPGALGNQIVSVSNRDTRVGLMFFPGETISFMWAQAGAILQEVRVPGSLSTLVADVNNRGVIAGSYLDNTGRWYGFLATPDPEADTARVASMDAPADMTARVASSVDRRDLCLGLLAQYGKQMTQRAQCTPEDLPAR